MLLTNLKPGRFFVISQLRKADENQHEPKDRIYLKIDPTTNYDPNCAALGSGKTYRLWHDTLVEEVSTAGFFDKENNLEIEA